MFSLGNFNHIVKSATDISVKHLIYRKLYAVSCSSGASPALSAVGRRAGHSSTPRLAQSHRCQTPTAVKLAAIIQIGSLMPRSTEVDPRILCGHPRASSKTPLPPRGMRSPVESCWAEGCGAGSWVSSALCRKWAEHVSAGSISDSFQSCLLGASLLLGVLLQGQGHGRAASASKGMWTAGRWPGNEADFEVSHGELEGHLQVVYERYCHNNVWQIWSHFPPHWIHLLLFFKEGLLFPVYLRFLLPSLSKNILLILPDACFFQKKSCWLNPYMVSKCYQISPIAYHSACEGDLDKQGLG